MTSKSPRVKCLPVVLASLIMTCAAANASALTITPVYTVSGSGDAFVLNAASQAVVNSAIQFYQNTFTDPITVSIEFHDMNSGLGASLAPHYNALYGTAAGYQAKLTADATSADDTTALASVPVNGGLEPVTGLDRIRVSSANGRAVGLNTPGAFITYTDPDTLDVFCDFTGDGCIGLNTGITTTGDGTNTGIYSLLATVQHEIDEVLGLGSSLRATGNSSRVSAEDLFRYASAGVRSYATNVSTPADDAAGTCPVATPRAYFSIDQGATNLNEFNNCDNGGDYGDWITHTPSHVNDAFTNGTGAPSLNLTSAETRALDVIGYDLTTVPEPSGLLLLGTGIAGVIVARRRARKNPA